MAVNTTNNLLEKYVGEIAADKLIELIKANLAGMASDADIDEALANLFLETKGGSGRYIKELRQTNGKIHAVEAPVLNTAVDGSIDPVSSGELFRLHKDSMFGIGKLSSDGAKNKLEISQESGIKNNASLSITGSSMTISGTGAYARCSFPITLKAGDYMFSYNCTANNSSTARIKFNTLADGTGTELSDDLIISSTGERATLLQLDNDTDFFVIYYANYGDTTPSGISLTIADSMICYQIEHAASDDYAEYAPANRLLYEQIKSLKQEVYEIITGGGSPEESVTYEGVTPLTIESNGTNATAWEFTANMTTSGNPSKSMPIYPEEFGDLIESGEHAGEYAITFTVGGNTHTIYLDEPMRKYGEYTDKLNSDGTVSRRVFKAVFNGSENWSYTAGMQKLPYDGTGNPGYLREAALISFCSHYTAVANQAQASLLDGQITFLVSGSGVNNLYIRDTAFSDATTFKAYLAAQYEANTPVCVWYVMAEETTESFTAPTVSLTNGSNTLAFATSLQPSYASITCTIGGGGYGTSASKVSYSNTASGLAANNAQKAIDELSQVQKRLYGIGFKQTTGDLETGESLTLDATNCKKNNVYSFMAKIDTFDRILVGQGFETYSGAWAEITDTKLIVHNYAQSDSTVEYTHGLTISGYVYVQIFVGVSKADIVIYSSGSSFKQTNVNWFGCNGDYFVKSDGSTLTNCVFTWSSADFRKSVWVFGDSYVGLNNVKRWATQLKNAGFADNVLFNGYAGEASSAAITALTNALKFGKPQKLVWCLGMNDGADSGNTVSTNYATGIAQVEALCAANGIELIYATIPSVPNQSNEAKNGYVRSTGKRYIDFAEAVGAAANGTWYTGMLDEDNVHPTEAGAIALYHRAIADCPEMMYANP